MPQSEINILKMLEDHLDPEIEALEQEATLLETQREEIDKRISKLKAIRRITNVPNKQQESPAIRPFRIEDNDNRGSSGL